jgi:hypothetical protein
VNAPAGATLETVLAIMAIMAIVCVGEGPLSIDPSTVGSIAGGIARSALPRSRHGTSEQPP